ncbi:semaphorin-3F-like [Chelonoidis abingdonii]|uniref:semaphorin-3F-like n=1 Tax=Chelonoidis abingdonii TaxID=106734 RepID=UPI003F499D8E
MAPPAPALVLGLLLPCALAWSCPLSTPRIYLPYKELLQTRTAQPFAFAFNTSDYRILLVDQDQDRLYLGTRDYLVALDLHNVNKEPLIIHWPASQSQQSACHMAGKGQQDECFNYVRLVEPVNRTHLYVCGTGAWQPVCALVHRGWRSENDDGGQRAPVSTWTTFLKARLVCSVMGEDGVETFFDELRDIFLLPTQDEKNPRVYGLFSTLGSVFQGSAVCVYPLSAIRSAFNGPFAHKEGRSYQWVPYTGRVPYPRPGACPGGAFTPGLGSTREFPDELVTFVRSHPLMYDPVYPAPRRPLLVRAGLPYGFTTLAVDLAQAADGRYEVLFLGTDRGTVQKVVVLPKNPGILEELTLEEVEVFKTPVPVKTLWISSKRACRPGLKHGEPLRQCRGSTPQEEQELVAQVAIRVEGGSVFLECPAPPPNASQVAAQPEGRHPDARCPGSESCCKTPQGVMLPGDKPARRGRTSQGNRNGYTRPAVPPARTVCPRLLGGSRPRVCQRTPTSQAARWGTHVGASQGARNSPPRN